MQGITPCLWFGNQAEDAVKFYSTVFKNLKVQTVARTSKEVAEVAGTREGSVLTIAFQIADQEFLALNGGPLFRFTEAVSFIVNCETQDEIDWYWEKLSDGGEKGQCGWLKDRFGLSWQIVPTVLAEMMRDKDTAKTQRVMSALLKMNKLVISALQQSYKG